MAVGGRKDLGQHLANPNLFEGNAPIAHQQPLEVALHCIKRGPAPGCAHSHHCACYPASVLVDDLEEHVAQHLLLAWRQVTRCAKIYKSDLVSDNHEIRRVGVGMVKAVDKDLLEIGLDAYRSDGGEFVPGLTQPVQLVELDAVQILQRNDLSAGQVPIYLRHPKAGITLQIIAQPFGIPSFHLIVHLLAQRPGQLIANGDDVIVAHHLRAALKKAGLAQQKVEVGFDFLFNARALHLDYDFLPVEKLGTVYLADGCGCDGCIIERGIELLNRRTQLQLDRLPDLVGGHRWSTI